MDRSIPMSLMTPTRSTEPANRMNRMNRITTIYPDRRRERP